MIARLNVAKVAVGAFIVPWLNRRYLVRALAVPMALIAGFALAWFYAAEQLPRFAAWIASIAYFGLFAVFAVICHRLVLLDSPRVARDSRVQWSLREMKFLGWMIAVYLTSAVVIVVPLMLVGNIAVNMNGDPRNAFEWLGLVAKVPATYVFARLCVLFPATAIDRDVTIKWAWNLTANNGWRITLLVGALPWLISHALDLLYR